MTKKSLPDKRKKEITNFIDLLFMKFNGKAEIIYKDLNYLLDINEKTKTAVFKYGKPLPLSKARLLCLYYGITFSELEKCNIKISKNFEKEKELELASKLKQDTVSSFYAFPSALSSSFNKESYKNDYINTILPYIKNLSNNIYVNQFLDRGIDINSEDREYQAYLASHEVIYREIIDKIDNIKYIRVLEINHKLHKEKESEKIKREALLLCPIILFNHIYQNYNKKNASFFASELTRPYCFGVFDDNYYFSEYYTAIESIYRPDILFVELKDINISHSYQMFNIYESYFDQYKTMAKERYKITQNDFTDFVDENLILGYLQKKFKSNFITKSEFENIKRLYHTKLNIMSKLL